MSAREAVSHIGIGYEAQTFPHDGTVVYDATLAGGSAQVGLAASLVASNSIGLAGDGENVEGVIVKVEPGGFCVVQTDGVAVFKGGTGATLTAGSRIVGALLSSAKGYIRSAAAATAAEHVLSRGRILDSSVSTAVVVDLD